MPRFLSLILICFLAQTGFINAQETIPFRITRHNNIIVKTIVNSKDALDLMFQIAMGDASLSPERKRETNSLRFDTTEYKDGISRGNVVQAGNIVKKEVVFFNNELSGPESDGKIGTGLFSGKFFKIDYDNNQFVTFDSLPDIENYDRIAIHADQTQLYVWGNTLFGELSLPHLFLLQSGYSGGLIYSNSFSDRHQLNEKMSIKSEKVFKNSAGQKVITKQGLIPKLGLANSILENVSAGIFVGDVKTQRVSYLGADLIRRFNWIFDKDRKYAYIQKSKYFNEPYLTF